jgi:hypothetical protein
VGYSGTFSKTNQSNLDEAHEQKKNKETKKQTKQTNEQKTSSQTLTRCSWSSLSCIQTSWHCLLSSLPVMPSLLPILNAASKPNTKNIFPWINNISIYWKKIVVIFNFLPRDLEKSTQGGPSVAHF